MCFWVTSGLGAFGAHASSRCSGTAVSHPAPAMRLRRVNIVRRHHTVANVGFGSCALCSYVCAQILVREHDAWAPLGRHGHACACMQCMPPHAYLAYFDALLAFYFILLDPCMFSMRMPAICVQHAGHACTPLLVFSRAVMHVTRHACHLAGPLQPSRPSPIVHIHPTSSYALACLWTDSSVHSAVYPGWSTRTLWRCRPLWLAGWRSFGSSSVVPGRG